MARTEIHHSVVALVLARHEWGWRCTECAKLFIKMAKTAVHRELAG